MDNGSELYRVAISPEEEHYLFDHQVKGVVVLPMVEVIDWFYQILKQKGGNPLMYQLNGFDVISGVKLGNFMQDTTMTIQHQLANLALYFNERLSYHARYEVMYPNSQSLAPIREYQGNWPWFAKEVYEKKILFHGKSFQVIHQLMGIDSTGCMGIICTKKPEDSPQVINKLLVDGGLQLACLWIRSLLKKASLPMRIATIKYYQPLKKTSLITCILNGTIKDNLRGLIDLQFFENNQLIIELSGLEMLVYEE